jgi:arylsulfatase A-like enzyme
MNASDRIDTLSMKQISSSGLTRREVLKYGLYGGLAVGLSSNIWMGACGKRKRPNIILITLDTTRADHLGCYGYNRPTSPNIDQLALESLLYDRAISPGTWTLPAHASLFTGKFTSSHGARFDPNGSLLYSHAVPGPEPWKNQLRMRTIATNEHTLASLLKTAGYETGSVVAGPYLKRIFGLAKGFDFHDEDNVASYNGRPAEEVTDSALKWLEKASEKPLFLFLNYFDPHRPYQPPYEYAKKFVSFKKPYGVRYLFLSALKRMDRNLFSRLYDAEICYMDHHLGRLFDGLKRFGIYDGSWIIVTSDHGELIGEHNRFSHGDRPYQEVVHIPMIVKGPGGRGARRTDSWIQLTDVLPMILEWLDIETPEGIQGSVPPNIDHPILIESRTMPPFEKDGHWTAIIDKESMKYIGNTKGINMLFDLKRDPGEHKNLLAQYPERGKSMSDAIDSYLARLPEPGPQTPPQQLDQETIEALRALGYIK